MSERKTDYTVQAPTKTDESSDIDELIQNAYRVIESVRMHHTPTATAKTNNGRETYSPSTKQMDIQRINRLCDEEDAGKYPLNPLSVEHNRETNTTASMLTSAAEHMNSHSTFEVNKLPDVTASDSSTIQPETIQLFNHNNATEMPADEEDDVIIISSNIPDIIDLCSPLYQPQGSNQRRRQNRNNSTMTSQQSGRLDSPIGNNLCLNPYLFNTMEQQSLDAPDPSITVDLNDSTLSSAVCSQNIPRRKVSSEDSILKCPVCMESSIKRKPTSTKCGHIFCESCINHALRITRKCPICNTKLNNRMLFRIYL